MGPQLGRNAKPLVSGLPVEGCSAAIRQVVHDRNAHHRPVCTAMLVLGWRIGIDQLRGVRQI